MLVIYNSLGKCFRAGTIDITIAMSLTKYLSKETNYFPWAVAIAELNFVASALRMTTSYGDFKVCIASSEILLI